MIKNSTNKIFIVTAAIVAAIVIFALIKNEGKTAEGRNTPRVCLNNACYEVEIAQTPAARTRGLMFRQELAEKEGMLFVFEEEAKHSFWMKNTLIPLDIVWIDSRGKIVDIAQNVPPCASDFCPSYAPTKAAKYVLEIAGGQMKKIGAQNGNFINFKI